MEKITRNSSTKILKCYWDCPLFLDQAIFFANCHHGSHICYICVGSNWLYSVCGLTRLVKSHEAMVGKFNEFNEFCFNVLMLFFALQLLSHSHLGSDVVETTLLSDFKSWWDISLGILFSWKLWLTHLCVNKTHWHTEYQSF